jgi:hypothetical protein
MDDRAIPIVVISSDVTGAFMWRALGRILVHRPYRAGEILRAIHQASRRRAMSEPRLARRPDS